MWRIRCEGVVKTVPTSPRRNKELRPVRDFSSSMLLYGTLSLFRTSFPCCYALLSLRRHHLQVLLHCCPLSTTLFRSSELRMRMGDWGVPFLNDNRDGYQVGGRDEDGGEGGEREPVELQVLDERWVGDLVAEREALIHTHAHTNTHIHTDAHMCTVRHTHMQARTYTVHWTSQRFRLSLQSFCSAERRLDSERCSSPWPGSHSNQWWKLQSIWRSGNECNIQNSRVGICLFLFVVKKELDKEENERGTDSEGNYWSPSQKVRKTSLQRSARWLFDRPLDSSPTNLQGERALEFYVLRS